MTADKPRGVLRLKKGREKPLQQRHPWIFSGAVASLEGEPQSGDLITVQSAGAETIGLALYSSRSQITGRMVAWGSREEMTPAFWRDRLARAYRHRALLGLPPQTDSCRLVFSEADQLPGLIVDLYAGFLVIQLLTAGMEARRDLIVELLAGLLLPDGRRPLGILERSDADVRQKEGLTGATGLLWGEEPPRPLVIRENDLALQVDLFTGHKTGFYLDQRDNRRLLSQPWLAADKEVLNVFAYTGGFAAAAARGGAAAVTNIDSSFSALELAEANVLANFPDREQDEYLAGDAFEILRDYRDAGRTFDVVLLDPPKFAHSQRDIPRASRGYKDINWLALRLLRPGGVLATFSCSGLITADLFQKILFGAAVDAGRDVQVMFPLAQAADHPILLTFPESAYLKGFLCRVW